MVLFIEEEGIRDLVCFFFLAEDGMRQFCLSRRHRDVFKKQPHGIPELLAVAVVVFLQA